MTAISTAKTPLIPPVQKSGSISSASSQTQARAVRLLVYRRVLHIELPRTNEMVRGKRPERLFFVLTRDDVALLLEPLTGVPRRMAPLIYGSAAKSTFALNAGKWFPLLRSIFCSSSVCRLMRTKAARNLVPLSNPRGPPHSIT